MKQYKKRIIKEFIKRKWKLKNEFKLNILKSILRNLAVQNMKRIHTQRSLQKLDKIKKNTQINKICMLTGKKRGVSTFFFLSRHMVKRLGNWNDLKGVKIKSW